MIKFEISKQNWDFGKLVCTTVGMVAFLIIKDSSDAIDGHINVCDLFYIE